MIETTEETLSLGWIAARFTAREGAGSVAIHLAVVKPVAWICKVTSASDGLV